MLTARDVVVFLVIFLVPGSLILIFARKMVEYNQRSYPRIYGRIGSVLALIMFYLGGLVWLAAGILYLTDRYR